MLEAIARDTLGDPDAAHAALERALDLSERSGDLTPFLLYPAAGLLERQARHRTAHAALVAEIRGLLAGTRTGPQHGAPPSSRPGPLLEPLSGSETRVLRYLPTNLSAPEIARELSVSPNTVKTRDAVFDIRAVLQFADALGCGDLGPPAASARPALHSRQTAGDPIATNTATCSAAVLGSRADIPAGPSRARPGLRRSIHRSSPACAKSPGISPSGPYTSARRAPLHLTPARASSP